MSKLITVWKYIRQHKYLITILVFLLVVVFLDENSLMKRAQYRQEISTLKSEIQSDKLIILNMNSAEEAQLMEE